MSEVQQTINELAHALDTHDLIDKKTMRNLTSNEIPVLNEYTGEEIQLLRKKQHLSQAVFAKYLNISPAMVRSLEQGQRHAHGAILMLLNLVDKKRLATFT